jgi:uncharacterized protein (TIGR00251 family)
MITLRVKPNAQKEGLFVDTQGQWVLRVKAPAQEGKANEAVCRYLAKVVGLAASQVRIVSGHTAPVKRVAFELSDALVLERLQASLKTDA